MSIPFEEIEIIRVPELNPSKKPPSSCDLFVVCTKDDYEGNEPLLNNILKAIKFEIEKNAFILLLENDETYNLSALQLQTSFSTALVFFVPSKRLGLNMRILKNSVMHTESFNMIYTNRLTEISDDKGKKKALWECLSKHFNS